MRNATKLCLTIAALGVVGLAVRDARAGNLEEPTAEYYSVEMSPGQYLSHSDEEAVIVVDDITYSCSYVPCEPDLACLFFDESDMPEDELEALTVPGNSFPVPHPPPPGFGIQYTRDTKHSGGAGWQRESEALNAKHKFQEVAMLDSGNGSEGWYFDRFSFNTYGQMLYLTEREWAWFEDWLFEAWSSSSGGIGIGDGGSGGIGVGRGVSLAATLVSVPSSGSRHYQSPHVLRNGRAYFVVTAGSNQITGTVNVKGRVISAPAPLPTVSTGLSVTTP